MIRAVASLMLAGCAAVGGAPERLTCEVVSERADPATLAELHAEQPGLFIVVGSSVLRCPCERRRAVTGATEQRRLGGQEEQRAVAGATEQRRSAGAVEGRALGGATESRGIAAATEERRLGGATEERSLAGSSEARRVDGASEARASAGATEERRVAGAAEERRLGGATEDRRVAGEVRALVCEYVAGCEGFVLRTRAPVAIYDGTLRRLPNACVN